jgi:hypothetical protein
VTTGRPRGHRVGLGDLATAFRFARDLPAFLRTPLDLEDAGRLVKERLARRDENLLDHLRHGVYANPRSPYRDLLRHAGCELGDAERLVRAEGVEGALAALYDAGVYLTIDEFKGRQPARRESTTVYIDPDRLRNPRASFQVPARSGGSRSAGTPVAFDLAFVRGCAASTGLFLAARGGATWRHASWQVPGSIVLFRLAEWTVLGAPPARWFSQIDPAAPDLHPRYRWSARLLRGVGALCGTSLPAPRYVPLDDPHPIATWMREELDQGNTPHLVTYASSAVRLSHAAQAANIDLTGAQLTLVGEAVTAARLDAIRRTGAVALPRYGASESGVVGYGCLIPTAPDDVHVLRDLQAVIQAGPRQGSVPAGGLLITSLHPASPFVMLNVAMGDAARMDTRACGCPLEGFGWPVHLDTIRSYEKLTAGGMTFLDTDVVRILDEVLPARFGGGPTDYQLVESEDADGRPGLSLFVHPRLGPLDPAGVTEVFLQAVGRGEGAERVMATVWREANLLRVERHAPLVGHTGKILHLHQNRGARAEPTGGRR